jgi:hypothetical protein
MRASRTQRVVIPRNDHYREASILEPVSNPAARVGRDVLVLPQVAANRDGIHRVRPRDVEASIERLAKLASARASVIQRQSNKWTIEMDVCDVQDLDWGAQRLSALKAIRWAACKPIVRAGRSLGGVMPPPSAGGLQWSSRC